MRYENDAVWLFFVRVKCPLRQSLADNRPGKKITAINLSLLWLTQNTFLFCVIVCETILVFFYSMRPWNIPVTSKNKRSQSCISNLKKGRFGTTFCMLSPHERPEGNLYRWIQIRHPTCVKVIFRSLYFPANYACMPCKTALLLLPSFPLCGSPSYRK